MGARAKVLRQIYVPVIIYIAVINLILSGSLFVPEQKEVQINLLFGAPIILWIMWGYRKYFQIDFEIGPVTEIRVKGDRGVVYNLSDKLARDAKSVDDVISMVVILGMIFLVMVPGYFWLAAIASLIALPFIEKKSKAEKTRKILRQRDIEAAIVPPPIPEGYGTARPGTNEELIELNNPENRNIGLWLGAGWIRTKMGGLMTVAQHGSGKGSCVIIPNFLIPPFGSYVVTDPKGELACITAAAQASFGQKVYIIDPWGEQEKIGAIHGIPASGFNPFDMLRMDMEKLPDNCAMIAQFLIPENPNERQTFWADRGREMVKLFLIHIVTSKPIEEQNFWTLHRMVRATSKQKFGELLLELKMNDAYDGMLQSGADDLEGSARAPEMFEGFMNHAKKATTIFESPQLKASLLKSDFNPFDLANGNVTMYLTVPSDYIKTHSAYTKIVIGLCAKAANSRPKPPNKVIFMLDEAGTMLGAGFKDQITELYTLSRGYGVIPWTFWQSFSQMDDLFGQNGANTVRSQAKVLQAFGIGTDIHGSKIVSEMFGKTTKQKYETSTSLNAMGEEGSSGGWRIYEHDLVTPNQVGQEMEIMMFIEGKNFIIPRQHYWNYPDEKMADYFNKMADPPPRVYS